MYAIKIPQDTKRNSYFIIIFYYYYYYQYNKHFKFILISNYHFNSLMKS